ncbi:MAG: hypothetical protein WKF60_09350 [Ilumatobacter sp.]
MTDNADLQWRYADDPGVGADDTANVMTLTDGRGVETRAQLLAVLTEWHNSNGALTVDELDHARRILSP